MGVLGRWAEVEIIAEAMRAVEQALEALRYCARPDCGRVFYRRGRSEYCSVRCQKCVAKRRERARERAA